jgi:hypothetical protein
MKKKNNPPSLTIIEGNLLNIPKGILVHQVNTQGIMGGGIALQIRQKWPTLFAEYEQRCLSGDLELGGVHFYQINKWLWVANLAGQNDLGGVATVYGAYETALPLVLGLSAKENLPVYLPHGIGCGLAGGDWGTMEPLLARLAPGATLVRFKDDQFNHADPVTVIRTCDGNYRAHSGFLWPAEGYVEAPDFSSEKECGKGLHGLLDGEGDWDLLDFSFGAKALVVETDRGQLIDLEGKVKFRSGIVRKSGDLIDLLCEFFADGVKIRKMTDEIIKSASFSTAAKNSPDTLAQDWAQIGSSGDWAQIGSSGHGAQIGSSGHGAQIGSSGHGAKIGSSGDWAQIGSSGHGAKIGSSGDRAKIGSSGDRAQIGSSGHGAQIGSSGDRAQIGSSGDRAQIGSSGHGAKIGSSGHGAKIGSSGHGAKIGSSGKCSVVLAAGVETTARAGEKGVIVLTRWVESEKRYRVSVGYVGEKGIKPNTNYRLNEAGDFEEVK